MGRTVVFDIETDDLNATLIHVIVCKDVDTGEISVFKNPSDNPQPFKEYSHDVDSWIAHHGLGFDCYWVNVLCGIDLSSKCIDTLILSRLWFYKLKGGHSLEAWGKRLGLHKGDFSDFSTLTQEMIDYCIQDVEVTHKLYEYLKPKILDNPAFDIAVKTEHEMAIVADHMSKDGFKFDLDSAKKDYEKITRALSWYDKKLAESFPPRAVLVKEMTPKLTKHGTISKVGMNWYEGNDYSIFSEGAKFSVIEYREFNPASPKQVVERLNESGWKPKNKTKGHLDILKNRERDPERLAHFQKYGWKVDEDNLATLPESAPEAATILSTWLLLKSRQRKIEEWIGLFNHKSGNIHGTFTSLGTWTHRMSHQRPNMGNIPRVSSPFGRSFRSYWITQRDEYLVGVDASGIQLRVLAHYINDPAFTTAVTEGREENGTDIHSVNKTNLGRVCTSRNKAKTFIYAWLLGASPTKISEIFGCSVQEAKQASDQFVRAYTGLPDLKHKTIPYDADRGYFEGLDGRWVACNSEHLMLAGYLQNGEAVIMKMATLLWRKELDRLEIDYTLRNLVHDEWQVSVKGGRCVADKAGSVMVDALRQVGKRLVLNCPLDGGVKVGSNWMETH